MLKKTLAAGAVVLASAGVLLSAAPAAAHAGAWTSGHGGSDVSGNIAYINGVDAANDGCGNSNAVLGQSLGSCYNSGVIIQN
ncbi:hypothetical protein GCM10007079_02650 [Nocardiopsis terrae]|uniref:Small secreted domain n=1 Tax=Nocardiopsis terrae TaxID=372655 RepID=A0ABR9HMQ2_9ACTN|nr:hypothetical protein [Nocardiopsis terrae]MBE1460317.1 hypothetical protein [Nocardiopsis terrae]GHC70792.1 hypothetical protein GCM10007079_02650 [Nocardiopsis terrae]